MIWHGVHILETFPIKKQELLLVLYLNNSPGTDFCHIDGPLNLAALFHFKSELRTLFLIITYCDCLIDPPSYVHVNVSCKVCCIATNLIKIRLISIHTYLHIKLCTNMIFFRNPSLETKLLNLVSQKRGVFQSTNLASILLYQ